MKYEIFAVKLEDEAILWRVCGSVDGCVIKLNSMTCDSEGNAYVTDRSCNRILKINSLTGEVSNILLVDDEEEEILSIHWSNSEPNLTLRTENQISSYAVPKLPDSPD